MEIFKQSTPLTDEALAGLVPALTEKYISAAGRRGMTETKFRIALEELLLTFRDQYGTEVPCTVTCGKFFGRITVEVTQDGPRKDWHPYEDGMQFSYDILARLGVKPHYSYQHAGAGRNRVVWEPSTVKIEKKKSMLPAMLGAIVLAVVTGLVLNALEPAVHDEIVNGLVSPVFRKLTAVFTAVATPLVFLAVVGGIVGLGDVRTFGKVGNHLLLRMGMSYLVAGVLLGVGGSLALGLSAAAEAGESTWSGVVQMVLDIIPDNLLLPFTQDNDLQVIVVAVFVGFVMLLLGSRVSRLNDLVREATDLINRMMMACCKLLPLIVYFGVTNLICSSSAKEFVRIAKMFAVYIALNVVYFAYMLIRARVITGTPLRTIISKQLATLMINITTSSQVAALPENLKCCKQKFGIESKYIDFAVPLGIVVYMPSGAIFIGLAAWGAALSVGMPVSLAVMLRIVVISIILAISAPPIPGSAFVVMPIMFAACGIPMEAFPLAVIFSTIIGYFLPPINGFNLQLEVLMTAKKLGLVKDDVLKAPYREE